VIIISLSITVISSSSPAIASEDNGNIVTVFAIGGLESVILTLPASSIAVKTSLLKTFVAPFSTSAPAKSAIIRKSMICVLMVFQFLIGSLVTPYP